MSKINNYNIGIGLSGAHRTGKSTLAKLFSDKYEIPYVETQVSKIITGLGYSANINYDMVTRVKIQKEVLRETVKLWESQTTQFITDRTPIDMVGYMIANATQGDMTDEFDGEFQEYITECKETTNKFFSNIIVIPPAIPIVETEGKANTTKTYIGHIAYVISGFVELHKYDMPKVSFDLMPSYVLSYSERLAYVNYKKNL